MRVARWRGNPTTLCWLARGSWAPNQALAADAATLTPAAAHLPALARKYFRAPAVRDDFLLQAAIARIPLAHLRLPELVAYTRARPTCFASLPKARRPRAASCSSHKTPHWRGTDAHTPGFAQPQLSQVAPIPRGTQEKLHVSPPPTAHVPLFSQRP